MVQEEMEKDKGATEALEMVATKTASAPQTLVMVRKTRHPEKEHHVL